MLVAGVRTHKVGEVAQTLMGFAPSASTVSRLNQTLTEQLETWRGSGGHQGRAGEAQPVQRRDKDGWRCLLTSICAVVGHHQMDLMVTDGHEGRLSAVSALFPATPRQRCVVQKQRHVMNAIPKRERSTVTTELTGIWKSLTKEEALIQWAAFQGKDQKRSPDAVRSLMEDEEHLLTFDAFPQVMHRSIRTTNAHSKLLEECAAAHRPD